MDQQLKEFLKEHEEDEVWFLLPSGLISGKIQLLESEEPAVIALSGALQFSGDIAVDLFEASVFTSQIIAWGSSMPVFIDKEED